MKIKTKFCERIAIWCGCRIIYFHLTYLWKWKTFCIWPRNIYKYYKGRYYCRRFHKPVVGSIGGYGGVNHFLMSKKSYKEMWCLSCDNKWEESSEGQKIYSSHWFENVN